MGELLYELKFGTSVKTAYEKIENEAGVFFGVNLMDILAFFSEFYKFDRESAHRAFEKELTGNNTTKSSLGWKDFSYILEGYLESNQIKPTEPIDESSEASMQALVSSLIEIMKEKTIKRNEREENTEFPPKYEEEEEEAGYEDEEEYYEGEYEDQEQEENEDPHNQFERPFNQRSSQLSNMFNTSAEHPITQSNEQRNSLEHLNSEKMLYEEQNLEKKKINKSSAFFEELDSLVDWNRPKLGQEESWITPYLNEQIENITYIFKSLEPNSQGLILATKARDLLREVLTLVNIASDQNDLFLFDRMIENRYKSGETYLRISFTKCLETIEEWARKESLIKWNYRKMLDETIKEFEPFSKSEIFSSFVDSLKLVRTHFFERIKKEHKSALELDELKGVKQIFYFYASQVEMMGKAPTFDEITEHKQLLNIGKFFKFCTDFRILGRESTKLSKDLLTKIFRNTASYGKELNDREFFDALDLVADQLYHRQSSEEASIEQKRIWLYNYLECNNSNLLAKKIKGFGLPFSNEKAGYRLPEYDLSFKYKFNDPRRVHSVVSTKEKPILKVLPERQPSVERNFKPKKLKNVVDTVTWGQLNSMKHNEFIKNEDLLTILTPEDIKEFLSSRKTNKSYK